MVRPPADELRAMDTTYVGNITAVAGGEPEPERLTATAQTLTAREKIDATVLAEAELAPTSDVSNTTFAAATARSCL